MTPTKLPLRRVIEIANAVATVGDNKYLEFSTAYRLGRLGDFCKPIARAFAKKETEVLKAGREREKEMRESVKNGSDKDKQEVNMKVQELAEGLSEEIQTIQDTTEEELKIPAFKLSDFIAKKDITELATVDGKLQPTVVVREGQNLVTVKFFTLMGDLIEDDKNAMANSK